MEDLARSLNSWHARCNTLDRISRVEIDLEPGLEDCSQ